MDERKRLEKLLNDPEALQKERARHQAEYMKEYRRTHPDAVTTNRALIRARGKAFQRLAKEHPERFREIYTEERAKEGLPPPRT